MGRPLLPPGVDVVVVHVPRVEVVATGLVVSVDVLVVAVDVAIVVVVGMAVVAVVAGVCMLLVSYMC